MYAMQGVKELWWAVVGQAIDDYNNNPLVFKSPHQQRQAKNIKESAKHWLFRSTLCGPGSLHWICENLELSKTYVRKIAKNPDLIK